MAPEITQCGCFLSLTFRFQRLHPNLNMVHRVAIWSHEGLHGHRKGSNWLLHLDPIYNCACIALWVFFIKIFSTQNFLCLHLNERRRISLLKNIAFQCMKTKKLLAQFVFSLQNVPTTLLNLFLAPSLKSSALCTLTESSRNINWLKVQIRVLNSKNMVLSEARGLLRTTTAHLWMTASTGPSSRHYFCLCDGFR